MFTVIKIFIYTHVQFSVLNVSSEYIRNLNKQKLKKTVICPCTYKYHLFQLKIFYNANAYMTKVQVV